MVTCGPKALRLSRVLEVPGSSLGRDTLDSCRSFDAQEALSSKGEGEITASQLNLPLTVAGCGRLQLGITHWATSVTLPQVVDN